jgi:hypothetical protein
MPQIVADHVQAQKQRCYESMKWHEILVERSDASASLGVRDRHDNEAMGRDRVMGRYSIVHVNAAGRKLLQMLGIHELFVPTRYSLEKSQHQAIF